MTQRLNTINSTIFLEINVSASNYTTSFLTCLLVDSIETPEELIWMKPQKTTNVASKNIF